LGYRAGCDILENKNISFPYQASNPRSSSGVVVILATLLWLPLYLMYEGWNFNSGNYLFTTDTK